MFRKWEMTNCQEIFYQVPNKSRKDRTAFLLRTACYSIDGFKDDYGTGKLYHLNQDPRTKLHK